jgi:hypothetical protein
MHPTVNQQLAVQATLNNLIGPREFDRLCLRMRVERIDRDILYVSFQTRTAQPKLKLIIRTNSPSRLSRFSVNLSAW